jgi:hypothetical protein
MGRRYRQQLANKKEIITYHVYRDNSLIQSFEGHKQGAIDLKEALLAGDPEAVIEIRKTRVSAPIVPDER